MSLVKTFLAFALFVTSVSMEKQVMASQNGIDVTWSASIEVSSSFALQQAQDAMEMAFE